MVKQKKGGGKCFEYHIKGECKNGDRCFFLHDEDPKEILGLMGKEEYKNYKKRKKEEYAEATKLDGNWSKATIAGNWLTWQDGANDGKRCRLLERTNSSFQIEFNGNTCYAELMDDGNLYWDDGDIWGRQEDQWKAQQEKERDKVIGDYVTLVDNFAEIHDSRHGPMEFGKTYQITGKYWNHEKNCYSLQVGGWWYSDGALRLQELSYEEIKEQTRTALAAQSVATNSAGCPNGHELKEVTAPGTGSCDSCGGRVQSGTQVWTCLLCNWLRCGICSRPISAGRPNRAIVAPEGMKPGDWICPNCNDLQFAKNDKCRMCGTDKFDTGDPEENQKLLEQQVNKRCEALAKFCTQHGLNVESAM